MKTFNNNNTRRKHLSEMKIQLINTKMETIIKFLVSFKIISIIIGLILTIFILLYLYRSTLFEPIIKTLKEHFPHILGYEKGALYFFMLFSLLGHGILFVVFAI